MFTCHNIWGSVRENWAFVILLCSIAATFKVLSFKLNAYITGSFYYCSLLSHNFCLLPERVGGGGEGGGGGGPYD